MENTKYTKDIDAVFDIVEKLHVSSEFKCECSALIDRLNIIKVMDLGGLTPNGISDYIIASLYHLNKTIRIMKKEAAENFNNLSAEDLEKHIKDLKEKKR